MIWRYTESQVAPEELIIRLNGLTQRFTKQDLDDSGSVDWLDALVFSPADSTHKAKLNFDYQILFKLDAANHGIMQAIHAGDVVLLGQQLDLHFGHGFTRFPVPDTRYTSVKVEVFLFGRGSVVSDGNYGIGVNSEQPSADNTASIFVPKNPEEIITLTATPTSETEILGWQGCDSVSVDLIQCAVSLDASRAVVTSFGYTTTVLKGPVHDLSTATNALTKDTVEVVIAIGDDALVAELNGMQIDDFVVGSTGDGFLRKVTTITRYDDHHYLLGTVEATLQEVVEQGTGNLVETMTNGDLQGYIAPTTVGGLASVADSAFEGLPGVRFIPSSDPDDPVFHFLLGESATSDDMEPRIAISKEVVLYDDGEDGKVTGTGSLEIEIDLDTGISYGSCYNSFGMNFLAGLKSEFEWDMSGETKLGKFLNLDKLESKTTFTLMSKEWILKTWHVDKTGCFTKLDAAGEDLPDSAAKWSCVRDDNTGLVWENKTIDGGVSDQGNTYSWYDPNPGTNGGWEGCMHPSIVEWDEDRYRYICYPKSGDYCPQDNCNTLCYSQAVSAANLCGASDWRTPTKDELTMLAQSSGALGEVDRDYFPYTLWTTYWSATPYAESWAWAWTVYLDTGHQSFGNSKNYERSGRVVRGGQ